MGKMKETTQIGAELVLEPGIEGDAETSYGGAEARRTIGGDYVSLAGGPHGEKPDEDGKYRGKGEQGLLWQGGLPIPIGE